MKIDVFIQDHYAYVGVGVDARWIAAIVVGAVVLAIAAYLIWRRKR